MWTRCAIPCILFSVSSLAQLPRAPDLDAQRTAMKKLAFLVGRWTGEARFLRGPVDIPVVLTQTEEVQYKLDGLILIVEGVGRGKTDNRPGLQALGVVSYDDDSGTYRMRAFNDGRFLESEVKLTDDGKGMTWGFTLGQVKTSSVMRIDEKGDWTESHDLKIGLQAPRKYMELRVSPQK